MNTYKQKEVKIIKKLLDATVKYSAFNGFYLM